MMTSKEHQNLASFIKKTHGCLREDSKKYGAESAWDRHVEKQEVLEVSTTYKYIFLYTRKISNNV